MIATIRWKVRAKNNFGQRPHALDSSLGLGRVILRDTFMMRCDTALVIPHFSKRGRMMFGPFAVRPGLPKCCRVSGSVPDMIEYVQRDIHTTAVMPASIIMFLHFRPYRWRTFRRQARMAIRTTTNANCLFKQPFLTLNSSSIFLGAIHQQLAKS